MSPVYWPPPSLLKQSAAVSRYDADQKEKHQRLLQIPWALPGGGISFDDFMITRSQHDVGMRELVQPGLKNICALGNAEKITVLIRNYSTDSLQNIPVTYAVNQDTVTEILPALAPKDSLQYTFTKTADMSVYQTYHIKAWVSSPTDNYRNNDSSVDYTIQTTPADQPVSLPGRI